METEPIECEYVFPILSEAAMVGLKVQTNDGAVLEAKVEDLEEAKEGYSDAIASGNQAVLGRMEAEDRMVMNVGNMAPRSKVRVTFTLIHPVKCEGKDWLFMLPAALIPLFDLGNAMEDLGIPEDDDDPDPVSLPFVRPANCSYRFHFHLTINTTSPITNCVCPSHTVSIDNPAPHFQAVVHTGSDSKILPNKDFRVMYETVDSMVPQVKVQFDPVSQDYAAMLSFIPPLLDPGEDVEDLIGTGEFLLLLDRSGSMQGSRIDMAREATLLFVKSLPAGCHFNVISFGTGMEKLFGQSVPYNAKSVATATKAISSFSANMNGTNILQPLQETFSKPPDPNLPRSVFLLTDGAVSNKDAVINLVESNAKDVRVHAFGIGEGVSTSLVNGVAQAGNGIAEFISNPNEIKAKVVNVLQKCLAPALTNNTVQWPLQPEQYPPNSRIPTCYFGEVFRVYAHFGKAPPPLGSTLTLRSRNSKTGNDVAFDVVIGPNMTEGKAIHLLWARQAIRDATYFAKTTSDTHAKNLAIQTSKKFGLPSIYTAFLCVESRADPVTGTMHFRKVPVVNTALSQPTAIASSSYGAIRMMKKSPASSIMLCCRAAPRSAVMKGFESPIEKKSKGSARPMATKSVRREAEEIELHSSPASSPSPLMELVQSQTVDGNWPISAISRLIRNIQCPETIRSQFGSEAEDVWATICVVIALQVKYGSEEAEWKLLAGKAKRWLKARGLSDISTYADQVVSLLAP